MDQVVNPIFEYVEIEFFKGTHYARKIVCKLCRDLVYEVQEKARKAEISIEINRLRFHLELHHGIVIFVAPCMDSAGVKKH